MCISASNLWLITFGLSVSAGSPLSQMKISQIIEQACQEAEVYRDAGIVSVNIFVLVCQVWVGHHLLWSPFISGRFDGGEHAWHPVLLHSGTWGVHVHDGCVLSSKADMPTTTTGCPDTVLCQQGGTVCRFGFRLVTVASRWLYGNLTMTSSWICNRTWLLR